MQELGKINTKSLYEYKNLTLGVKIIGVYDFINIIIKLNKI